jgi:hypothetical protein
MNVTCFYDQTPFTLSMEEKVAALRKMHAENLQHYDARCPRCGRANAISRERLEMFTPGWEEAIKSPEAAPMTTPTPMPAPSMPAAAAPMAAAAVAAKPKKAAPARRRHKAAVKKTSRKAKPATKKTAKKPAKKNPAKKKVVRKTARKTGKARKKK